MPHRRQEGRADMSIKQEQYKSMAEWMLCKAGIVEIYKGEGRYAGNLRECPFYSELQGMMQALKTLGISYEFHYDEDLNVTGVTVGGVYAD